VRVQSPVCSDREHYSRLRKSQFIGLEISTNLHINLTRYGYFWSLSFSSSLAGRGAEVPASCDRAVIVRPGDADALFLKRSLCRRKAARSSRIELKLSCAVLNDALMKKRRFENERGRQQRRPVYVSKCL